MSYDVDLIIDAGGDEPAAIGESLNITYNLGPMFQLAFGDGEQRPKGRRRTDGLYRLSGLTGREAAPLIDAAVADMRALPSKYRELNPPNGWGTYESAIAFLDELRERCVAHPKATVRVW